MKNLYTAHATSVRGRSGHVETDDKHLSLDLTPSTSKTGTNPEQLFACAYAACFGSALESVAKKEKINTGVITVKSDVDLNQDDNNGYFLGVTLNISMSELDQAHTAQLVNKAHMACPYSKATRGNISVSLKVDDQPLARAA